MFVVGLTGGIGSGKSAASKLFLQLGVSIIDADIASREVVVPGKPALNAISEHFGNQVLEVDGSLNRGALRTIIFQRPSERVWLEGLLHPLIREQIQNQLASVRGAYTILASPLLLESDQYLLVNRVLVIDCEPSQQISRVVGRDGVSQEQAEAIMAAQLSRQDRLARADDIIQNNQSFEVLRAAVQALDKKYRQFSSGQ